ncbi:MAG TPA: hypothetical protein VLD60_00425 [Nitrospira sp.]|nr:hypothetical protein [Nitrospira sp.]
MGARFKEDHKFSLGSASLRQALQEMPEITEVSKHIMLEETKRGLTIENVDQDGRSMFPDGAKEPFKRTRKIIQKIAPQLKAMPYRLSIVGHTASSKVPSKPGYGHGNCRLTEQTPCGKSWKRKVCRLAIFLWLLARLTPIPCFQTIPPCPRPPGDNYVDEGRTASTRKFDPVKGGIEGWGKALCS